MQLSGVYRIRNVITGEKYIGSSVHVIRRWKHHQRLLRRGRHRNRSLQRAWNRWGPQAFTFELLTLCEPKRLLQMEQRYLPKQQTFSELKRQGYYNVNPIAGSTRSRRKQTNVN